jgi:hypothetical protein
MFLIIPAILLQCSYQFDDWNELRKRHPDADELEGDIPQWQKDILDHRMLLLKQNPEQVTSMEDFLKELDADDDKL